LIASPPSFPGPTELEPHATRVRETNAKPSHGERIVEVYRAGDADRPLLPRFADAVIEATLATAPVCTVARVPSGDTSMISYASARVTPPSGTQTIRLPG
jgi:hypothetical protein